MRRLFEGGVYCKLVTTIVNLLYHLNANLSNTINPKKLRIKVIYLFNLNDYIWTVHFFYIILSITKFSIVIGSPCAYLSRNRRAITWVSNHSCPIWTFCNRTPVIGYPRDFHVNYARFNGFLSNVFCSFQNLGKALRTLSKKFLEDVFNSEICYRHD